LSQYFHRAEVVAQIGIVELQVTFELEVEVLVHLFKGLLNLVGVMLDVVSQDALKRDSHLGFEHLVLHDAIEHDF